MARMPDGWVITVEADRSEVRLKESRELVRCASCKWWDGSTLGTAHRCAALHIATTGEFYCAAGERDSMSTIDAIPVGWLRKIADDAEIELNDRACIKWLIGEWQKEQAKEHCGPNYCEIV